MFVSRSFRCERAFFFAVIVASIATGFLETIRAAEPERILLWKHGAPGEPATKPEDEPVLLMKRPTSEAATSAVIVIPGGAYAGLAMDHEGTQIADWLNSIGVAAFILKYRQHGTGHQHPVPMTDGQRAIRTVRGRAAEWKIDSARVGVMGFSAGGHLASTLGTHFDAGHAKSSDPIDQISSRPDFMILCYPVISMTAEYAHTGSRNNLLGNAPAAELLESLSNETQVTPQTPPTFLFHTNEDTGVLPENSVAFYSALRRAGVPAELHIYEAGRHGVGLAKDVPGTNTWPARCHDWMRARGILGKHESINAPQQQGQSP
jgi:acetyl esterase/lipase